MKSYIVSEEELRRVAGYVVLDDWIDEYINTKQPITKVAEGEVNIYDDFDLDITSIGGMEIHNQMEKFIKYDGKHIEIYIKESK